MPTLQPISTVAVQTHLNDFGGMSQAALVICDDGRKYVIKRASLGRPLVGEHVVARLGLRIGAPCMEVCLATLSGELIALDPKLARFASGPAHASIFVDGLQEIRNITHAVHPLNRTRFAMLYILFSWAHASDHQYLYELKPPNLVYSHDHGLFFSGAQNWTAAGLTSSHIPKLDATFQSLAFTAQDLALGRTELESVTDAEIAGVVNAVPLAWGATGDDLNALIAYLCARRKALLGMLPAA
jgi:hypothetical protein